LKQAQKPFWHGSVRAGLVVAASFLAADLAFSQPLGQLTGAIKDDSNQPLAGVTVDVTGPEHRTTTTNADGHFEIMGLTSGDYLLATNLMGFAPARRSLRIDPGQLIQVALTLSVHLLEQTIVTAAKSGESDVQTTPMAISVLPASDLARFGTHTVEQLAGQAPSVTFSQNTGFSQLTIRGIGTNVVFAGSDPSSAVYADGVYLARPAMVLADFLDLERVEVLRGPQGTLYGRNAVGGAVNLVTRPPSNVFEASADVAAGNYDELRAQMRVSGPLVQDRVMASAAFLRGARTGFVNDVDHPDHPLGGENVTAGRGQLRVVLSPRADLLMSADINFRDPTPLTYAKVLAVKPGFTLDNPSDLHDVRASTLGQSRDMQYGAAARFTVSLSPQTKLTSLSAFRSLDYDVLIDADISELKLASSHVHEIQHQFSEELTVTQQRRRMKWIGGLFLFGEDDRQPTVIDFQTQRLDNTLDPSVTATSAAVFGEAQVDLVARLSATAGLRYSDEGKTIANSGRFATQDTPVQTVPGTAYSYTDEISNAAWTPKFGLDLRVSDNVLLYGSATRGFKSGGFNPTSNTAGRGYAPEWAWSYEAGLKSSVWRGRTNINVAAFHTDYTDLQVQTAIRPGVIDISNAASARIDGLEVESATRLARGLQAGGHVAWLNSRYDRYIAVGVGGVTGDVAGNRLTNAPVWSGRAWVGWEGPLVRQQLLSLRADTTWQTTAYFTPFNDAIQRQQPYGLLNVSADIRPSEGHWSLGIFGRNLTNQDYITGTFSSPPPAIGGRPGDPRQIGVQLRLRR
jgi:iron complex outermembrane receptor protein